MAKVERSDIKRLILNEMRMLGMADMPIMNTPISQRGYDEFDTAPELDVPSVDGARSEFLQTVSREDCCAAIMCLVECCSCPVTRREIKRCCDEILAGEYDR